MRIIAGKYKHRIIAKTVPPGVRPTTDQVRETIFNILSGYVEWEGARVLDLCAGTGALGFEALSRGAEYCDFVELNKLTARQIETTAISLHLSINSYRVHHSESVQFLKEVAPSHPYSVIFTDPPYHKKLVNPLLSLLWKRSLIPNGGIFVAEHDNSEILILPENFTRLSSRTFGATIVDFLEFASS